MSDMAVNLRQVCTGKTVVAHLDVTPEELDITSASTVFRYFHVSARSDQTLTAAECNNLSYTVASGDYMADGEDEIDATIVVSDRIKELSILVEKVIENDPDIKEQDENVINRVLPTGSSVANINMQLIRQHLSAILGNVFSAETIQNSTPMRLLIDFAMVVRYCYNFCTKLCERVRNLVESIVPDRVFNILCGVVSILMKHLSSIGWRTVLETIGGWAGAARSVAILPTLPVLPTNVFLAVSVVSAAASIISATAYLYLSHQSS